MTLAKLEVSHHYSPVSVTYLQFPLLSGVHIPMANLTFLSSVSERLSTAIPSHALGVLVQFTSGLGLASSVEGAALVHCARPWLPHLQVLVHTPREERSVVQQKIRRSIRQIIQVAFKQPAVSYFFPASRYGLTFLL